MKYSFTCYGHENVTATHKTTLEFTKDKDLGLEGDCIVGVGADFDLKEIKKFIELLKNNRKITIIIEAIKEGYNNKDSNKNKTNNNLIINNDSNNKIINNEINKKIKNNNNKIIEKINAEINPNFNSNEEMVIRKTDFISERTFAIRADKAAFELNSDLIGFLKGNESEIRVIVENIKQIDF